MVLQRDNEELKQVIDKLMKHFPVDQLSPREVSDSGFDNAFRKYVNTRISSLEDKINDLRKEVEFLKSKKPFHHDSRRPEKEGTSKRFFPDTRDELYSPQRICERTSSGEGS